MRNNRLPEPLEKFNFEKLMLIFFAVVGMFEKVTELVPEAIDTGVPKTTRLAAIKARTSAEDSPAADAALVPAVVMVRDMINPRIPLP
jgi:hypothetical protein